MSGRPPGADESAEDAAGRGSAPVASRTRLIESSAESVIEPGGLSAQRSRRSFAREIPFLVAIALVVALLLKTFLVQAFYIPSPSMVPTLRPGDRILVNRLAYRFGDIERGDIVVFTDPKASPDTNVVGAFFRWLVEGLGVARPANEDFVKRVIGLPGDAIEISNGEVFVNGTALDEPYLDPHPDTRSFGPITVPPTMLFVMGDNRLESADSRFPPPVGLGYVPVDHVVGRAFLIVWPPSRAGGIR